MLSPVGLVDQWREIERALPREWTDARLVLRVAEPAEVARAAALLAPLTPGRAGQTLRFLCARRGAGPGPEAVRRALRRLDSERIEGELELVAAGEPTAVPEASRAALAAAWDAAVSALPDDWSDLYVEVELFSTDYIERAALLLSPANPARYGGAAALRFRCAHSFGYGASPEMVRRCLERLDESSIRGSVRILRALADSDPVATQGPVWYIEGKAV